MSAAAAPARGGASVRLAWALALSLLGTLMFLLPEMRSAGHAYQTIRAYSDVLFAAPLAAAGFLAAGRTADIGWTTLLVVGLSFAGWLVVERVFGLAFHPGPAGLDLGTALGAVGDCLLPLAVGTSIGLVWRAVTGRLSPPSDDR